jgi:hypothetical protein
VNAQYDTDVVSLETVAIRPSLRGHPLTGKLMRWALLLLGLLVFGAPIMYCWEHAAPVTDPPGSLPGSLPVYAFPAIPGHLS